LSPRLSVVDIGRCTGCNACTIACKDRAGLPDDLDYLRLERVESGQYPDVDMYYRVMHCFHCEEPPCADVCPVGAISKRDDGFVQLDAGICSNCGACKDACPFDSIVELPGGFHSKCDGCHDEVANGWDHTCVRACITRALSFKKTDELEAVDRVDEDFIDHGIGPAVVYLAKRKN
jgi:anaerobic dimethyl sulfoxide reductase subunit B (iron-sulfur subunit)